MIKNKGGDVSWERRQAKASGEERSGEAATEKDQAPKGKKNRGAKDRV
jgi:hypothetical protein